MLHSISGSTAATDRAEPAVYRFHRTVRKALILSPTASHPQDYGNRNRVYQTTSFLKQQGYEIHFILYPVEPDWRRGIPESARTMRTEWDSFTIAPTTLAVQPPAVGNYHLIDEWWDPGIEAYLKWLFEHEFYDVFVVNYAFLSKAFEFAPRATAKILETHDRFSGRRELLTTLGAPLEAFYTTEDQEAIALDRSDVVVAIKESEAVFYRKLTKRRVISVPFWPGWKETPSSKPAGSAIGLRVGFIGALNVVNVANMARFLDSFERYCTSESVPVTLDVAGEVCIQLLSASDQINLLGFVQDIDAFYESVDVIVAPMMFSTGLKIKVAEAMAHGKPIVSTVNGFDGFTPTDEFHALESIDEVSRAIVRLARDPARFKELQSTTAAAAQLARKQNELGYGELMRAIASLSGATVLVTDISLSSEDDVQAVRLRQWAELCSQITPTVVAYVVSDRRPLPGNELKRFDIAEIDSEGDIVDKFLSFLQDLTEFSVVVELIISVSGELGEALWQRLRGEQNITLDTWIPRLARAASSELPPLMSSDMWLAPTDKADGGTYLSTAAFRQLPTKLKGWKGTGGKGIIIVRCGAGDYDNAGIEILSEKSVAGGSLQVVTLSTSDDADFNLDFLDELLSCGKPRVLVAVGDDRRGHAVCRTLGVLTATACLVLSSTTLPVAIKRNDGRIHLCCSFREIAEHFNDAEELVRICSAHHEGAGWMSYSRLLATRARKSLSGTSEASLLPMSEILLRGMPQSLAKLVG